jgi:hypothetical protein
MDEDTIPEEAIPLDESYKPPKILRYLTAVELRDVSILAKNRGYTSYISNDGKRAVFTSEDVAVVKVVYDASNETEPPIIKVTWTAPNDGDVDPAQSYKFQKIIGQANRICLELDIHYKLHEQVLNNINAMLK